LTRKTSVEAVFDDARAAGEWPTEEELLEAFATDVDDACEDELEDLGNRLHDFTQRLEITGRKIQER
jgi:hypothetical protein